MRKFLFLMEGENPFIVHADDRRAARIAGREALGYFDNMPSPRCVAVAVA
jgi:hypothetical protein